MRIVLLVVLCTACADPVQLRFDSGVALIDGGGNDGGPAFDAGPRPDGGSADSTRPIADAGPMPIVDPSCTDGMYRETFPNVNAPVGDIAFTGDISAYVDAFLDRRYPIGALLVRGGRMHPAFPTPCDITFAAGASSAAEVIGRINTIVHECGHLHNANIGAYAVTETLTLTCERGDTVARGGDTFARSLIRDDAYSSLRPPGGSSFGQDIYADVYLSGSPDDGNFDSGDQGFNLLLEEMVQYLNSVAVAWAIVDQLDPALSTGDRDGLLTLMWYVERYLHMARLEFPAAYARISNPCWRNAILTFWGRAWLYLNATTDFPTLSLDTDALTSLVTSPDMLGEIERLRALEGC